MAYRVVQFSMTLNDAEGHSPDGPIASLFKCDFSHRCAVINKISTDGATRVIGVWTKTRNELIGCI